MLFGITRGHLSKSGAAGIGRENSDLISSNKLHYTTEDVGFRLCIIPLSNPSMQKSCIAWNPASPRSNRLRV